AARDVDAGGCEDDVVRVARNDVGDVRVQRASLLVPTAERRFVLRERPIASLDPLPARVDVDVEPDGQRVAERVSHGRRGDRASAEREHDRLLLQRPEGRLSFLAEELRDRHSRRRLDEVVGVDAAELTGCGGLARAHEADDRDALLQIRSTYARQAPTKSPIASPPNFSWAARASSHATAASATTASASTAETSLRSTSALAASPVWRSTEASGFISVGSGFMPARTTISSPFDMPPSMPPARLDVRRL